MPISPLAAGQPIDIFPLGSALANTRSEALFKTEQLECMRLGPVDRQIGTTAQGGQ